MKRENIVLRDKKENTVYKVIKSIAEEKGLNFTNSTIKEIAENTIYAVECKNWDIVDAIHHYISLEFSKGIIDLEEDGFDTLEFAVID